MCPLSPSDHDVTEPKNFRSTQSLTSFLLGQTMNENDRIPSSFTEELFALTLEELEEESRRRENVPSLFRKTALTEFHSHSVSLGNIGKNMNVFNGRL